MKPRPSRRMAQWMLQPFLPAVSARFEINERMALVCCEHTCTINIFKTAVCDHTGAVHVFKAAACAIWAREPFLALLVGHFPLQSYNIRGPLQYRYARRMDVVYGEHTYQGGRAKCLLLKVHYQASQYETPPRSSTTYIRGTYIHT